MSVLEQEWRQPPDGLNLPDNEVHIWKLALEQPVDQLDTLARLLSPAEHARAARFHFERDRRRFIVSHAGLRQILGAYLSREPAQLRFTAGAQGKPHLADEFAGSGMQFNLTHSHELALLAVTRCRAVGIDLEYLHPPSDMLSLAARFFSAAEYATLVGLPEAQQMPAFFNCWTRKEAYLKATGKGLSGGLSQVQVSMKPDEPPRLLTVDNASTQAACWTLISLEPAPHYIAAAALNCCSSETESEIAGANGYRIQLYSYALPATTAESRSDDVS